VLILKKVYLLVTKGVVKARSITNSKLTRLYIISLGLFYRSRLLFLSYFTNNLLVVLIDLT
jgi:hypothetical protein